MDAQRIETHYTYADYCAWDDETRYELIDGVPYAMSPAPTQAHQTIIGRIFNEIFNFLKGKPCQIFLAPFDVRLNAEAGDDTVVQPDLLVVCDKTKLDGKACVGAPDMVIEVLSQSTARHDRLVKFRLYEKVGVREYWIVDHENSIVEVHILENGHYNKQAFGESDDLHVHILEGCTINLADIFG